MATGKTEAALQALFAHISTVSGPEIVRNEVEGGDIPVAGRVNQLDGNRGEPEALLSPLRYGVSAPRRTDRHGSESGSGRAG